MGEQTSTRGKIRRGRGRETNRIQEEDRERWREWEKKKAP